MMLFIRTQRLFLRPNFPEDWHSLFMALHGTDQASTAGWDIARMLARMPWPYSEQDAQAFCDLDAVPGSYHLAITVPDAAGAPVVGQIGLSPLPDGEHELGYWIGAGWQGQGLASEAASGLLGSLRALGFGRIAASHFVDNPASGQVLISCGFSDTGEVRDIECLARGEHVQARRYICDLSLRQAA